MRNNNVLAITMYHLIAFINYINFTQAFFFFYKNSIIFFFFASTFPCTVQIMTFLTKDDTNKLHHKTTLENEPLNNSIKTHWRD